MHDPLPPRRRLLRVAAVAAMAPLGLALTLPLPLRAAPPAAFRDIQWEDLVPKDWDPLKDLKELKNVDPTGRLADTDPKAQALLKRMREIWDAAPTVAALQGQSVRLPGFVVPLDDSPEGLRTFLLVPYFGACIHTPPPPANQIILVAPRPPVKGLKSMDAVWVKGRLTTDRNASSMGTSSYRLEAVGIEPYVEKAR